jgi:hypothetical protein
LGGCAQGVASKAAEDLGCKVCAGAIDIVGAAKDARDGVRQFADELFLR